jgi:hypothetical protein
MKKYDASQKWSGPTRPYDLVKEATIAFVVVALLSIALAGIFSSPDEKAVTLQSWSQSAPADFVQTAAGELAGSTVSGQYGPPYNTAAEGQQLGPIKVAKFMGVRIPINSAQDFVIKPLGTLNDPSTNAAIAQWNAATDKTELSWATSYAVALTKAATATTLADPASKYGPVPTLVNSLYAMAKTGALDGALTTSDSPLPTNFTKPLLFLADSGSYFPGLADAQHLSGDQWGVMNETGSWPGQSWLWLYSLWYQVDPFKSSGNADILVMSLMGLLSIGFVLIPFLPILHRIPERIPIHRIIWRDWYRNERRNS